MDMALSIREEVGSKIINPKLSHFHLYFLYFRFHVTNFRETESLHHVQ
jgi:hypothetical protein